MESYPLITHHKRNIEESFKEEMSDLFELLIETLSKSPYNPSQIFFKGISLKDSNNWIIGETGIISDSSQNFQEKIIAKLIKHRQKNELFKQINQDIIEKEIEINEVELSMKANMLYECNFFELKNSEQNWGDFLRRYLLNNLEQSLVQLQPFGSFKLISKIKNIDGTLTNEIGKVKIIAFPKTSIDIENIHKNIIFEKELNKLLNKQILNVDYQEYGNSIPFTSIQRFSVRWGKPHGYGVIETSDIKYSGEFKNGKFHGHGVMIFKTKAMKYDGLFDNGYFIHGKIYSINEMFNGWCSIADNYEHNRWNPCRNFNVGEFHVDNFWNVKKVYTRKFLRGVIDCEGDILNDKINGWGIQYHNGRKYMEGEFIESTLMKGNIYYYDERTGVITEVNYWNESYY